ncbi:MAG TPA: DUF1269 domain-containing protein [Candidatus Limnocylindrales bacterium]|nr:DUF1269 domain-containing protein [Candidatus Limnocylindrales bacterium]
MTVELEQTLAVFVFENDKGSKRFLKKLQTIDKADKRVEIVDAAFANRTRLGRVKVHQTRDRGGMKGGIRGGAFGVVVGTIIAGPAGAVAVGAAGAVLAGLRNRFHDIGIDDKFMRRVGKEIDKGRSALFILYQGNWEASIGTIQDAVRAEKGLLIESTLPADKAAALRALVEPAAEQLGGEEVVTDFEVDVVGEPDDLTQLSGIGDKSAKALAAAGITTYRALADSSEPKLRNVLHGADMTAPASIGTWPMQAEYAANGDWQGLMKLQQKADAKAKKNGKKAKAAPAPEKPAKPDDLTKLNGIGPRIQVILADGGVTTYSKLAKTSTEDLRLIIAAGGALPPSSLSKWPAQAGFAAKGDWEGLATYNHRK